MAGKTQVDVHRGDLGAQLSVMHPQVRAHGAQLLTSMISGLDDGDDPQSLVALEAMLGLAKLLGLVEPWDLRSVLLHVAVRIRPFFDSVGWAGAGRHRGPPRAHSQPAHPGACFLTLLPLPRSLGSTCALGPRSCVTIAPSLGLLGGWVLQTALPVVAPCPHLFLPASHHRSRWGNKNGVRTGMARGWAKLGGPCEVTPALPPRKRWTSVLRPSASLGTSTRPAMGTARTSSWSKSLGDWCPYYCTCRIPRPLWPV